MNRLFQIAHRRILTQLKGPSKQGITNNEVGSAKTEGLIPQNIHEHVKDYFSNENPQIKPHNFVFNHTTDIYHLLPKDQLKNYLRVPCPIDKPITNKENDGKDNKKKKGNSQKPQVLSEADQQIILNAKKIRSVMNMIEEKVCEKCPFKQSCQFSTTKFQDLTITEEQQKKYKNVLELTPLQGLIFHNQKMYQLGLLPESTFTDRFGYRVWTSGYRIMYNLETMLKILKESELQTKQFLQIREKYIAQIKLQEAQGIKGKQQDQGQVQSVKTKNQKKNREKKQEKLKVDFSDYAEPDVYKKLEKQEKIQTKQRKKGRNIGKKQKIQDEQDEQWEDDQSQFVQPKDAKKSFYEKKQSKRTQDNQKVSNPFTVKWGQQQDQNAFRNVKNELQMQDFQKKQGKRNQRQPSQAKPWQQRQQRQSKPWQQREPRQSKPWQSKPWQKRQPGQFKQRNQRQGKQYGNRNQNNRNREGDFGRTNQYPRRNNERKDSYANSYVQQSGGQFRGDRRSSQAYQKNNSQGYERKRSPENEQINRPKRNQDRQGNGYNPSKRNK